MKNLQASRTKVAIARRPGRAQAYRPFHCASLVLAAAAVFAVCGCKKAAPTQMPPPIVEVVAVAPTNVPFAVEFIGQLDSPQNVEVRARVEAFVETNLFVEGTEVKAGDPLFKLDDKPFKERLAAAKGMLGEAEAALKKDEADVARLAPLAAKKAIPQQDLDNAVASVEVGKASVVSAQARVESALLDLGYCDVRAPITGLIGAKQVSMGELVGKGQPTLMATISTLDPIWFYCSVSEVDLLKAHAEAGRTGNKMSDVPVSLTLSDGSVHPSKGKIVFVDRAVDVTTGTLRVRAEFPNPEKILRPGMFARIALDLGARPNTILVPERAVAELQGKNFVWIVDSESKASQRPILVGRRMGPNLVVQDGLKPGEHIVVEGLQKIREGMVVKPLTAAQLAEAAAQAAKAAEAKQAEAKSGKESEAKHGKD